MHQHIEGNAAIDTPISTGATRSSKRRWMLAAAIVAAVGATSLAGASYAGQGMEGMHGGHGGARHHAMDPAKAARHIDHMIAKIAPEATAQQKARLKEIATAAFADLKPLRAELRTTHKRVHELLMAPVVDRAALETLRAEQMQRLDAVSKRMTGAMADAAEVLTPEQRLRLAEHMNKRMHKGMHN